MIRAHPTPVGVLRHCHIFLHELFSIFLSTSNQKKLTKQNSKKAFFFTRHPNDFLLLPQYLCGYINLFYLTNHVFYFTFIVSVFLWYLFLFDYSIDWFYSLADERMLIFLRRIASLLLLFDLFEKKIDIISSTTKKCDHFWYPFDQRKQLSF